MCNVSKTQTTKKIIDKCLLIYLIFSKFALYEETEFTQMICLCVIRLNMVKRNSSRVSLSLFLYIVM